MTAVGKRKDILTIAGGQEPLIRVEPGQDALTLSAKLPYETLVLIGEFLSLFRDTLPKSLEITQQRLAREHQEDQARDRRLSEVKRQNQRIGRLCARRLRKLDVHGIDRSLAIARLAAEVSLSPAALEIHIRFHNKALKARRKRMRLHVIRRMDRAGEPTREIANRLGVSEVQVRRLRKQVKAEKRWK